FHDRNQRRFGCCSCAVTRPWPVGRGMRERDSGSSAAAQRPVSSSSTTAPGTSGFIPALPRTTQSLPPSLRGNGFVGGSHPLEGADGLFHGYSDVARPDRAVAGLGERFEILHTAIKPPPACRYRTLRSTRLSSSLRRMTSHRPRFAGYGLVFPMPATT